MKVIIYVLKICFLALTITRAMIIVFCVVYVTVYPPKINLGKAIWLSGDLVLDVLMCFGIYKVLSYILENYEANGL